jgi:nucleotide-binding universal stress UspA family protein
MIKINQLLCPIDLSTDGDQAVRYALALRHAYEAKLFLCYCATQGKAADYEAAQSRISELFDRVNTFPHVNWEGLVIPGEDVGGTIIRTAAEHGIDLIVMRSRRRPQRAALLGSTAEWVCRGAPCPVLVTHSDERECIDKSSGRIILKRVLVAYDFSDYSELAMKYALSLAQEHQAELHLLHVLPPGTVGEPEIAWYPVGRESAYHQAARRLQRAVPEEAYLWCHIKHAVSEGQPYREILNYAEKNEIDLISLGAHGAGFGMRALFGSNVDRVLRQAPCPVLVARPLRPSFTANLQAEPARAVTQA